ncbi:hypothetical protein RB195_003337 [Necator americanus]|uniref:Guanylate cyclase n=1 Tax=Necator americanus TaxID=51031 RepID=A0ABR1DN23_NECAM
MPRYCLFGDTVNTASRMESNGKAAHIHLSKEAHSLLNNKYPDDYATLSRGEVIIKGKGVMETYWLIGRKESIPLDLVIKNNEGRTDISSPQRAEFPDEKIIESEALYRSYINVGIAATEQVLSSFMAHSLSGGAIGIALDRMEAEGLTYGFQFRFFVNYTECSGSEAAGVAVDFMKNRNMDVVIAPPCPEAAKIMAHLSTFYKKTLLGWGFLSDSEFSDSERFPYLTKALPDSLSMMKSVLQLFQMYDWNRVAIFYSPNEVQYCDSIIDDAMGAFADESTYMVEVVQKSVWNRQDDDNFRNQMLRAKRAARIIVMCLDTAKDRRTFMKTALRLDMVSDEFVYVLLGMRGFAFVANGLTPYWEDLENNHADDQIVKEASLKLLVVDVNGDDVDRETLKNFTENVVPRVREDPLYCSTNACLTNDGKPMATWARYLHDVFYLYGLSLNDSLTLDPVGGQSNASTLSHSMRRSFVGLTGAVTINENGSRVPLFSVYGLDSNYNQVTFVNFTLANGVPVMSKGYTDEATSIWTTRRGKRPLSRPVCGYSGTDCPEAFWDKYSVYVITGAAILALFLLATILFFVYIISDSLVTSPRSSTRMGSTNCPDTGNMSSIPMEDTSVVAKIRQMEQEQLRLQWQVPYIKLRKPPSKKELQHLSKPSLQSGPSTITGDSRFNSEANFGNYTVYFIDKDAVLTTKHPISAITQEDYVRFPKDLISKGSLWFDPFFMFCIMRDIAEGLRFLHASFIGSHGRLRSGCCLVNDSWQVKISDYGIESLAEEERLKRKRLLWIAPEHLRDSRTSKEGDVFSFAIISSEVITRRAAWNIHERKESVDELIYMIKKGGPIPLRPDLSAEAEISNATLHLIRDCWSENPSERPAAEMICKLLKSTMPDTKANLMDHMFNMLEEYTTTLELDVEERTKQLQEEKKKADILLGRMLPRQVADRLKLGQTVEPEGFDCVTVFFSDVVKFTQLAAKCSAFQVVSLLNDLYGGFDSIIEELCVYKVESIGDGYLCVSGLPTRNGYTHIKEIADLSLSFMDFADKFRFSPLPRERVQLRIGMNTGPCVAGVVGLSMPRYCLFGDTVNTASRMESNGKAGHIHLSKEARNLLNGKYPEDYETQSRGEVIIKGKGVMETFWLIGKKGWNPPDPVIKTNVARIEISPPQRTDSRDEKIMQSEALYRNYIRSNTIEASE